MRATHGEPHMQNSALVILILLLVAGGVLALGSPGASRITTAVDSCLLF